MENSGYVFLKALEGLFLDRMESNEEKLMDDSYTYRVATVTMTRIFKKLLVTIF
jgi:hypothetical protein